MTPPIFPHRTLAVRVLAAFALAYGLGALIGSLLPHRGIGLDVEVASWFATHRTDVVTSLARVVTTIGSPSGLALTAILVAALLASRTRSGRYPAVLTVGVIGVELLTSAIKLTVERPRPPLPGAVAHVSAYGYSFPSGHATQSTAIYTLLAVVIAQQCTRRSARAVAAVVALSAITAVGVSRLYLGVHWISDVASGWLIGAVWLTGLVVALGLLRTPGAEGAADDPAQRPRGELAGPQP